MLKHVVMLLKLHSSDRSSMPNAKIVHAIKKKVIDSCRDDLIDRNGK